MNLSNGVANLLVTGARVIDPSQGLDEVADVLVADGKVAWIGAKGAGPMPSAPQECPRIEAQGLIVAPGFVDLHCHLREPGQEHKETIASGTLAAARGGFTTVCAMPNTVPPADNASVVEYVLRKAQEEGAVRVLPIGCITRGQRGEELADMAELAEAGAVAFSDDGRPVANSRIMRHAMEYSLAFGLPVIDHCQDPELTEEAAMNEGAVSARLGLKGWPAAAEEIMVARNIALAELTGARLHLAHISTAGSVDLVRRAKERGLPVTAEVTPHHLTLTEERVMGPGYGLIGIKYNSGTSYEPAPYDTSAKVNPPLRTRRDVEALVAGLREGVIDAIATDHAPHAIEDKLCEFDAAAFGISGLETALGALMSLVHRGELDLPTLIRRLTWDPAQVLGSGYRGSVTHGLGTLAIGAPGDLVLFDPDAEWEVEPSVFTSKGRNTPLAECVLKGRVVATVVGGVRVYG